MPVKNYVLIGIGILCVIYMFIYLDLNKKIYETPGEKVLKSGNPDIQEKPKEVEKIVEKVVEVKKRKDKYNVTVVALANEIGEAYCFNFASILLHGYQLYVYGPEHFPKAVSNEDNQRHKQRAYLDFCSQKRGEEDVVVFSDIKDVAFVRESKELVDHFYLMSGRLHKRVIFGAEKELHPFKNANIWNCEEFDKEKALKHYNRLLPNDHIRDKYLNSGLFMGEFEPVCDFIQSSNFKREILSKQGCTEEQATCVITFFENSRWVGLDYYSELFYNSFGTREMLDYSVKDGIPIVINTEANTSQNRPFVLHGNGGSGGDHEIRKIWRLPKEKFKDATLVYDKKTVKYFDLCKEDYPFWKDKV